MEDLQEELPTSQPRFVVYSYCYNHEDGRQSYPLCFIFVTPQGKWTDYTEHMLVTSVECHSQNLPIHACF